MKRLVVYCDGTWQSVENRYPTNVLKIAQAIMLTDLGGVPQVVFYDSGVGAVPGLERYSQGAFGIGIDDKIQAAYRFLCLNHDPGDEIYLFGFSRGAYTVRSLAGLIYNSGLLRRGNVHRTPEAYAVYRTRTGAYRPSGDRAVEFRREYGERVGITALCCWDTVGALGIPDTVPLVSSLVNARYRFYDTTLNPGIKRAFHAVSVDEIRKVFDVTPMRAHGSRQDRQVTQVWFPGEHSCIGGGMEEYRGLSDNTLDWMISMVTPLGLAIDRGMIQDGIRSDPTTPFENRPRGVYRLTGIVHRRIDPALDRISDAVRARLAKCRDYAPPNLAGIDLEKPATYQP